MFSAGEQRTAGEAEIGAPNQIAMADTYLIGGVVNGLLTAMSDLLTISMTPAAAQDEDIAPLMPFLTGSAAIASIVMQSVAWPDPGKASSSGEGIALTAMGFNYAAYWVPPLVALLATSEEKTGVGNNLQQVLNTSSGGLALLSGVVAIAYGVSTGLVNDYSAVDYAISPTNLLLDWLTVSWIRQQIWEDFRAHIRSGLADLRRRFSC